MSHIVDIALDDAWLPPPTPEIEQERKVAMFDLLAMKLRRVPLQLIVVARITAKKAGMNLPTDKWEVG